MPTHDVIVIGASAGGLDALKQIARRLPADLPAALFIVQHIPANGPGVLPAILANHGPLPVGHAQDGETILRGRIYVGPPDRHLVIDDGVVRLVRGPKENLARPAIDPLFRSAAVSAGPRVVGVVLTGSLYDGTSGAAAIKRCGGKVIVQDAAEAYSPSMPQSVLEHVEVDHCLPLSAIPQTLAELAHRRVESREGETMPRELKDEVQITSQRLSDADMLRYVEGTGRKTMLTCPDCSGTLWEIKDSQVLRYRCPVGHAFTGATVQDSGADKLENQLWSVLRQLQESLTLAQRLAEHAQWRGRTTRNEEIQQDTAEHRSWPRAFGLSCNGTWGSRFAAGKVFEIPLVTTDPWSGSRASPWADWWNGRSGPLRRGLRAYEIEALRAIAPLPSR